MLMFERSCKRANSEGFYNNSKPKIIKNFFSNKSRKIFTYQFLVLSMKILILIMNFKAFFNDNVP